MKKRKMIYPGDPVYYDEDNRMFKKAGKGRIYLGQSSLSNKKPMKEGTKVILKHDGKKVTRTMLKHGYNGRYG